jgi:RNA polymerase sigma factor (sigma-70 family)
MAAGQLSKVIEHLRRVLVNPDTMGLADGELLHRYVGEKDEAAFEALVRRHGPMVMGVCQRVLRHAHDAEDAFQATFLVLVRKASALRCPGSIGNWLYGVAYRTALEARKVAAKRRAKEAKVLRPSETPEDVWADLRPLLDQELQRLPEKYRSIIVLCDLGGKTRREAARHLGWPEGTVASRLARARTMLAKRLARHGVVLSGAAMAVMLSEKAAPAAVQPSVIAATIKAASSFAAGQAAATGAISAKVVALTEGVLKTVLLTKVKIATAFLLAAGMVAAGATSSSYYTFAAQEKTAKERDVPKSESTAAGEREPTEGSPPRIEKSPSDRPGAPEDTHDELSIRGSGNVVTKEMPFSDFTSVEVSRLFRVEIIRADSFRMAISADDNLVPHVQVLKNGSTLRISLASRVKSFWATALKATIAMPALEGVRLEQLSKVTCRGFRSGRVFQAKVTGQSTLDGEIEADKLDLDATGLSTVTLKGRGKEAKISASQQCRLALANLALDQADVTLKNRSRATVHVNERLNYDLSAACRLEFVGNPRITQGKISDGSLVAPHSAATAVQRAVPSNHHHGAGPAQSQRSQGTNSGSPVRVTVGDKVPDFALRDLDGRVLQFSELRENAMRGNRGTIVLSFWCSTCSSCRRVERHLDKLAKDYQGQALVLALDANAGEAPENVKAFAKKHGLTLPIFLNSDGRAADVFGTEVTTTTVVIDRDGVLRYCGRFRDGDRHAYVEDALKAVLAGNEVVVKTTLHDG